MNVDAENNCGLRSIELNNLVQESLREKLVYTRPI